MNIFMVTSVPLVPPWNQADKNLAYTLARAMPEHSFRVLTVKDQPPPPGENLIAVPVYPSERPTLAQKIAVFGQMLTAPFGDSKPVAPDIYHFVHQPYSLSSRLCRMLPEIRNRPTLHTLPTSAGSEPLRPDLFFTDSVVVLSEYGRRLLTDLGVSNVEVIPPGIVVDQWFALHGRGEELKEHFGLAGRPVILYPGHYGPGYGADVVLRALPAIADQVPDVALIFACRPHSPADEPRERQARRLIAELGLQHAARFFTVVDDMVSLIGASDLVLLPLETMRDKMDVPTSLLQALAAGKPIVISDIPPMNALLAGKVGLGVPRGDAQALAQAVVTLLADARLRQRMSRRGTALVRERFDIRQVAARYQQLYRQLSGRLAAEVG